MLSRLLLAAAVLPFALLLVPLVLGQDAPAGAKPVELPLARVVLFNAGVGYFQREGVVDGNARVEMRFPEPDVNDLLKSLTVDDGGKPGAVGYDGTEPAEHALRSFTIDLNGNPTLGQLLNQARGHKVEVTLDGAVQGLYGGLVLRF